MYTDNITDQIEQAITIDNIHDPIHGTYIGDNEFVSSIRGVCYYIPSSYTSKSQILPGDTLFLRISKKGRKIYKLDKKVRRHVISGLLTREGKKYILQGTNTISYTIPTTHIHQTKAKIGDTIIGISSDYESAHEAYIQTIQI